MRFFHLSDLHLGKSIHGLSLLDSGDQEYWMEQFIALAEKVRPDAVVIAGDIYDRSAPSGEAVKLLDRMLTALAAQGIPVFLIAGNHDSGQRLSFAADLLAKQNVHIAGTLSRELKHVTLQDEYGPVTFWMMPYLFPALVSHVLENEEIRDYNTAVRCLLEVQNIDFSQRNVIIAHQNVTANGAEGERGGSETMVGGVGQVDVTVFDGFDYVALGHIHAAYPVGRETVRYAGSPLCYHFNETRQAQKGPLLVTLRDRESTPGIETLSILPLHPMREVQGTFDELRSAELVSQKKGEYLKIVLTDQRVSPQIAEFFHSLYDERGSVLLELASEYDAFTGKTNALDAKAVREKTVEDLFADFYQERNGGVPLTDNDTALLAYAGELLRHADLRMAPQKQDIEKLLKTLMEQEERR